MTKMASASLLVAVLCGPALADNKTLQLGFTLTAGKDTRHYAMKLVADACGTIESKAPEQQDHINVCMKADSTSEFRLEVDWTTRHDNSELHNRSTVVAARGSSFDLDGGAAKLAVALQ